MLDIMNTTMVKVEDTELFITEPEKSIQINDLPEDKAEVIWKWILVNYPDYETFFSFNSERMGNNHEIPTEFLAEINAQLVDDALNFSLNVKDFTPGNGDELEIRVLTEAEFAGFAKLHDHCSPNFFWTSKRLQERLDIWQIHTLETDGNLVGYVMTMITNQNFAEIFKIKSNNELEFKALLSTTCQAAFTNGKTEILYMIEKVAPTSHQQVAINLGFKETGFYKGFRAAINEVN